jgi:hypothetical protein
MTDRAEAPGVAHSRVGARERSFWLGVLVCEAAWIGAIAFLLVRFLL